MQKKALLLLLLALVMGAVAVFLVNTLLTKEVQQRRQSQTIETSKIVVAAKDLTTGTRLDRQSLKVVDWPADALPKESYSRIDDLLTSEKPPIVLKQTRVNEPVLPYKLSHRGARAGLPPRIPEDKRAFTISVNEVTGVAGFVMPGNYVDVILTTSEGRRDKRPATRTVLQNIEVLGIDQISTEDREDPEVVNAVTLLVSPDEGKMLALAQTIGELNLMLRNEYDASLVEDRLITVEGLAWVEMVPKVTPTKVYQRVRRPLPTVEVIRGLSIEQQSVQQGQPQPTGTPAPAATKPEEQKR